MVNICLVSDFFYPNMGGVEMHQFNLAMGLIKRGHKVVAVTHAYGNRSGIRHLTRGLKVYHIPWPPIVAQTTYPTLFCATTLLREIFVRDQVQVVHGHASASALACEGMVCAYMMGIPAVFTCHSLFDFTEVDAILLNKCIKCAITSCSAAIAVSFTARENLCLRTKIPPEVTYVIPNAVTASDFTPNPAMKDSKRIKIVVVSRLVYRKGTDLLAGIIPKVCQLYPDVDFIIGGDGNMRLLLEEVRERHQLQDRVELLGSLPHDKVRDTLIRGSIFLNTSLTEAFCIAILEAASCGLVVVSTDVGGVPEVLPSNMVILAEADVQALVTAVGDAIAAVPDMDAEANHAAVAKMYSWDSVAQRTEIVYKSVMHIPQPPFMTKVKRYYACGPLIGKIMVAFITIMYLWLQFLEHVRPREDIDTPPDLVHALATLSRKEKARRPRRRQTTRGVAPGV